MDRVFEQSQKVFADELSWLTQQITTASERLVSGSDTWLKAGQEVFGRAISEQTALFNEGVRHAKALAEKQAQIVRDAFSPAA